MQNINFLIKPSSSKCNMKCKYCFYHDVSNQRNIKDYGFMSEDTIENLINKALDISNGGSISFAFQGGEPTLIGLSFFKNFVNYVNKSNSKKSRISYAIQTNGLVITREWAEFFKENNFLVGLSLDGTKDINDINRIDYSDNGTFKRVMNASKIFDEKKVDYNILIVVTNVVSRKIASIYSFFKKQNFRYLQFIPCLDPLEDEDLKAFSLSSDKYGDFLKKLFDLWYRDAIKGDLISIRFFDNILGIFLGREPESCDMVGHCSLQHVIEADGSVYPCDFYVLDEYKLGNINTDSIEAIHQNNILHNFINKSTIIHSKCKTCKWGKLCRGGCKRHKRIDSNGNLGLNHFCDAYCTFYEYSHLKFNEIANLIYRKNRG